MKKYFLVLLCFLSISLLSAQSNNYRPNQIGSFSQLTGEDYITGEDGVPRMSINVWGHVKYPGTYLVYDGIDLLTCLSLSGGPMKGAKLSKVSIVSIDGTSLVINVDDIINNRNRSAYKIKPYDTVYVDQTFGNYILTRSSVINTVLQLINLVININK